MLDVHAIADDQLARPITSWSVRAVANNQRLGRIEVIGGDVRAARGSCAINGSRYRLELVTGEVSVHEGLAEARAAAARAFTTPPQFLLN